MNDLWTNAEQTTRGYREVDPMTLASFEDADVRIIDVREASEYMGPLGHIAGSELVPLGELSEHLCAMGMDSFGKDPESRHQLLGRQNFPLRC